RRWRPPPHPATRPRPSPTCPTGLSTKTCTLSRAQTCASSRASTRPGPEPDSTASPHASSPGCLPVAPPPPPLLTLLLLLPLLRMRMRMLRMLQCLAAPPLTVPMVPPRLLRPREGSAQTRTRRPRNPAAPLGGASREGKRLPATRPLRRLLLPGPPRPTLHGLGSWRARRRRDAAD
ncbi:hypothetical protein HK405_001236, partial [Cladochytrium tenue]